MQRVWCRKLETDWTPSDSSLVSSKWCRKLETDWTPSDDSLVSSKVRCDWSSCQWHNDPFPFLIFLSLTPWDNRNGWLGVKHQITYFLSCLFFAVCVDYDVFFNAWSKFSWIIVAFNCTWGGVGPCKCSFLLSGTNTAFQPVSQSLKSIIFIAESITMRNVFSLEWLSAWNAFNSVFYDFMFHVFMKQATAKIRMHLLYVALQEVTLCMVVWWTQNAPGLRQVSGGISHPSAISTSLWWLLKKRAMKS